jgi:hyperosmotically inducible periplasmic protein
MKSTRGAALYSILFAMVLSAYFPHSSRALAQEPTAPDNTKVNRQDQSNAATTADQQKENATDRALTRRIRQALIKDKSLSTYAHNVKIITQGGMVTLKGPVRSEEEKQTIEAKAKEVAGADKVTSELEVKPKA